MQKLKLIKRFMFKVKLHYRGVEMSLWDFAGRPDFDQDSFSDRY